MRIPPFHLFYTINSDFFGGRGWAVFHADIQSVRSICMEGWDFEGDLHAQNPPAWNCIMNFFMIQCVPLAQKRQELEKNWTVSGHCKF